MSSSANNKGFYLAKKRKIDSTLEKVTSEMLADNADNYNEALFYTLMAGAKRVRPVLALVVYEMFKEDSDEILDAVCALELVHAASLMQDDLPSIDNGQLRRGKPASHIKFGESTTILASAALWMKAFDVIARTGHPDAVKLVQDAARLTGFDGLLLGQYFDIENATKPMSIEEIKHYYVLKTSSMFRLAVRIGAVLGDADKETQSKLDDFALKLGLAFQIRDDILDVTEDSKTTGKDANKDEENSKPNYISLMGLNGARSELKNYLDECTGIIDSMKLETDKLKSIVIMLKL